MENASKALIIAGAILISILLIGLGVYVYNMAQSATQDVGLDSQAAEAQNNQFTSYFGNRKSSADVKNLMSAIRSNNITGQTAEEEKQISVIWKGSLSDTTTVSKDVKPGKTYFIGTNNDKAATDDELKKAVTADSPAYYPSGYLRVIVVKENGADS